MQTNSEFNGVDAPTAADLAAPPKRDPTLPFSSSGGMIIPPTNILRGLVREASFGTQQSQAVGEKRPAAVDLAPLRAAKRVFLDFSSVVKVFATVQPPDFDTPWQTRGIGKGSGSGVAILDASGRPRILTSAHLVAHSTFVQVQRAGKEIERHVATVHAICHDCDLAILNVEDSSTFWNGIRVGSLGPMPTQRSVVLVAGFPIGGDEMSISEGVVNRIEGQTYRHSRRRLLTITVDAAINSGNSGGPVFNVRGELVGIAFQGMAGPAVSNIGHIIPPVVIRHFLNGIAEAGPGGYRGFPGSGIEAQNLVNPYLRAEHKVPEGVSGVLVTQVLFGQTCDGVLEAGDVITHIAGQSVANDGSISCGGGKSGRVDIGIIFSMMRVGSSVELGIIRDGTPTTVTVITKPLQKLVPLQFHNKHPPYFIYCGLVFQPLTLDYINKSRAGAMNPNYVSLCCDGVQHKDCKRAVVITQVLSDRVNMGYEFLASQKILKVNGENVVDMADLICKIEATVGPTVRLGCSRGQNVVLPSPSNPEATVANQRISQNYSLTNDRHLED